MTQEEKQLLLKDLCARSPYGVYVRINEIHCLDKNESITEGFIGGYCKPNMCQDYSLDEIYEFLDEDDDVKLYLRPISSMTKEEKEELKYEIELELQALEGEEGHNTVSAAPAAFEIDFYNKHHIDFRGLIPMGLALEAPEGIYKTE